MCIDLYHRIRPLVQVYAKNHHEINPLLIHDAGPFCPLSGFTSVKLDMLHLPTLAHMTPQLLNRVS